MNYNSLFFINNLQENFEIDIRGSHGDKGIQGEEGDIGEKGNKGVEAAVTALRMIGL